MSIFVVFWHMGGGGRSLIFSEDKYLEHVFTMSDFINFHLLLLAVPAFIFVSIYLYASKPVSISTFKKQFTRVFILLTFWPLAFILYRKGFQGLLAIVPSSPVEVIYTALRAGHTIYYFFTSLIICLVISHLFLHLKQNLQLSVFILSIVLLAFLPQLTKMTGLYPLSAYWNPLNFIPLSFAAVLVAQHERNFIKNRKIILLVSLILSVFFSIVEWKYSIAPIFFPGQGYAIPAYTRISLLFSVIAVFLIALSPTIRTNSVIKYMARYSLALYCLHPFFMSPVRHIVAVFVQNETVGLYISIILVVVFSYSIAMLLMKYYLKEEVVV